MIKQYGMIFLFPKMGSQERNSVDGVELEWKS